MAFRKLFTIPCVKYVFIPISATTNLHKAKYHFNRITKLNSFFSNGFFKFCCVEHTIIKFYQIFMRQN